jgi:putative nucleotidyltransferase-like protein
MKAASDLLACTLRGDLAWTATESWDAHVLATAADHHGVGPLVWRALQSHGTRPHGLYEIFAAARHVDLAHEILRRRETARVLDAFSARGLDVLLVKGAALAYSVYDEAWLRPRVDTDLLVDSGSLVAADRLLQGLGYAPAPDISTGEFVSHQVAYAHRDRHGLSHVIDLHWKTANPQLLADALPFAILWRDAIEVRRNELRGRAPSLAASLLLACVHRLAHHQQHERLVWLFDIHLLAGALDDDGWNRFTSTARERGIIAVCRSGLEAASARLGTVVPDHVLSALDVTGQEEPSRVYTERTQRRLDVLLADLRWLPRWRDRLRLLAEHAFPPASFVMARYAARRRVLLPVLYAHRLVTGAWKWLRA